MLLESKGVKYQEHSIDDDPQARSAMKKRANGRNTVPQIFIDNQGIGGCDDLYQLEHTQQLNQLLRLPN